MAVYFIRAVGSAGPIKIGWSKNVAERMRTINRWVPFDLELLADLPGAHAEEQRVHLAFAHARRRMEWFDGTDGIAALIRDAATSRDASVISTASLARYAALDGEGVAVGIATAWWRITIAHEGSRTALKPESVARASGMSVAYLDSLRLRSSATMPPNIARRIASAFGVNAKWIEDGSEAMVRDATR